MTARQRPRIEPTDDWRQLARNPVERLFAHSRARLVDRASMALAAATPSSQLQRDGGGRAIRGHASPIGRR